MSEFELLDRKWDITEGAEPVTCTAEEIVEVSLILLVVELPPIFFELVCVIVTLRFEDISRLKQYLLKAGQSPCWFVDKD